MKTEPSYTFSNKGVINSYLISSAPQKFLNSFETYSPPLSLRTTLTFLLDSFSTNSLNSQNFVKVWSLFYMK